MNDIERSRLRAELKTRLEALDALAELSWLGEVANVLTLILADGEMRTFGVNVATRPHIAAILQEEAARLEAIALGVDRKAGP